jgi:hypothetical protein
MKHMATLHEGQTDGCANNASSCVTGWIHRIAAASAAVGMPVALGR